MDFPTYTVSMEKGATYRITFDDDKMDEYCVYLADYVYMIVSGYPYTKATGESITYKEPCGEGIYRGVLGDDSTDTFYESINMKISIGENVSELRSVVYSVKIDDSLNDAEKLMNKYGKMSKDEIYRSMIEEYSDKTPIHVGPYGGYEWVAHEMDYLVEWEDARITLPSFLRIEKV